MYNGAGALARERRKRDVCKVDSCNVNKAQYFCVSIFAPFFALIKPHLELEALQAARLKEHEYRLGASRYHAAGLMP